jgi:hypothetical protein
MAAGPVITIDARMLPVVFKTGSCTAFNGVGLKIDERRCRFVASESERSSQ